MSNESKNALFAEVAPDPVKDLELVSEKIVIHKEKNFHIRVYEGTGEHAVSAQLRADGKEESVMPNLMAQLVTINNKMLAPEDFKNLPLKVFLNASQLFNEANF